MLKTSFNFLDVIIKCQECSKSEAIHEIWEVLLYAKDQMVGLRTDLQTKSDNLDNLFGYSI